MMKTLSAGAVIVVSILAACTEPPSSPHMQLPDAVSTARAPAISAVPLVVTISSVDGAGNPYRIQGDGNGAYTHGIQDVQAELDVSGTFAFNTYTRNRTAARWVTYDFNDPVDPSNTYRPSPSSAKNYHFSTGPSDFSPMIPIQNLGVNGNPVSECIYMGNSVANATTQWRVSFHKGLEDVPNSSSAFAVVTRTSVSPAVWTITPSGACSPISNVASLRNDDSTILYGYYRLPFFFTLRAK